MSIRLERVTFAYGDSPILLDVSWTLPDCGVVCLWGPSGCGKTTLLRLLAGLEKPTAGYIVRRPTTASVLDKPLREIPANGSGWCPERAAMVFQEDRLLPWLTALENVTLVGAETEKAAALLRLLGLGDEEIHSLPKNLSGGQQRRVALARALAADSDYLLLDEPFNGLDEDTWRSILPLIAEYAAHRPVVLVTHLRSQADALEAQIIPLHGIPLMGTLNRENL